MRNEIISNPGEISPVENNIQSILPFDDRFFVWGTDTYDLVLHADILWI